jgi:hypothetical protein
MNKKYAICFNYGENSETEIKSFINALKNLESLRDECKGKVPYFWGMRKNWFPLVLLRAAKVGNQQALTMFNQMVQDRNAHSIYYKTWSTAFVDPCGSLDMREYYVITISIDPDNLPYVAAILNFFGFRYHFSDCFEGIWPTY